MQTTDVAVVGAGPIGLELAVALKSAGIDYLHFDAGQIGQIIYSFPTQTRFFSSNDRIGIAGLPLQTPDQSKATREEYLAYLRSVVGHFDLDVRTFERVESVTPMDAGGFTLATRTAAGEHRYRAGRVVLATGGTAQPNRLGIPGEDLVHVHHVLEDPHRYFRRRVLVVGGKNSAVEAALRCYHAGARVAISYRRAAFDPEHVKYWLLPELNGRIERGEIEGHLSTVPVAIHPTHVTLEPVSEGSPRLDVAADFVLVAVGYVADMALFRSAGARLTDPDQAPAFDARTMETEVRGLYVAGTAVAGTQQSYKIFLENCHVHVDRIVAALTGTRPPAPPPEPLMPES